MQFRKFIAIMAATLGAASAHAGTYTCDVELNVNSKLSPAQS